MEENRYKRLTTRHGNSVVVADMASAIDRLAMLEDGLVSKQLVWADATLVKDGLRVYRVANKSPYIRKYKIYEMFIKDGEWVLHGVINGTNLDWHFPLSEVNKTWWFNRPEAEKHLARIDT